MRKNERVAARHIIILEALGVDTIFTRPLILNIVRNFVLSYFVISDCYNFDCSMNKCRLLYILETIYCEHCDKFCIITFCNQ